MTKLVNNPVVKLLLPTALGALGAIMAMLYPMGFKAFCAGLAVPVF